MRVIKVFLVGLLYGWFMRWIIDEIYLKDNLRLIANENEQLRDRIRLLEAPRPLETRPIMQTTPQPDQRPAPAPAPAPTATRSATRRTTTQWDDLKQIKGIGPVMEKKLNAAGVRTFEQFSRLTTQELQNILGLSKRVVQSADNLITQAKKLAQQK